MIEKLNTSHEILAVANIVRSRDKAPYKSLKVVGRLVDGFDVYLPNPVEELAAQYGMWLLKNPHPDVHLNFSASDIVQE